jgi:hypothetical protein
MRHVIAPLFIVFVFLALLLVGAILLRRLGWRSGTQRVEASYEALPALLTPAERSFFGVLQQALAADYRIFAKVRLADIVQPVRNLSRSGWQSAFNHIAGKHVDFVLCDSAHLRIVGVIELDDSTHGTFERGVRDTLVDSALADARIPILRVPARQSYSLAELRQQVENLCRPDERVSKRVP